MVKNKDKYYYYVHNNKCYVYILHIVLPRSIYIHSVNFVLYVYLICVKALGLQGKKT